MPIIYKSGNRSLGLEDLVRAETDRERLKISLRLVTENYDVHSFTTTRLPAFTIVAHACDEDIIWEDFVKDFVEGEINLNDKNIEVYVEKSGGLADCVHVFDTQFRLIGVGPIYGFDWTSPPKFHFRNNGYYHYIKTDASMKRIVSDTSDFRLMTQEDIDSIREYWAESDAGNNTTFGATSFIMPQFQE